ncbi:MAG: T9SS type A sorting domain-containing protein [Bacteroidales bacterium]|nr:T9SS type A sorting domain-containing protein [Bacteroidales bacterium]
MKKLILFLISTGIIQNVANSQGCLPDGITFSTQTEIDNFQTNYPGCTEIEGDVLIFGDNITNLQGLSVLTAVDGDFDIGTGNYGNPNLTNLSGLENLMVIGGDLYISNNHSLASLNSLNVSSIGNGLVIMENISLTDLHGLDNINYIPGYFLISENSQLETLEGLNNLTSTGNDFRIFTNDILHDLAALYNLTSIGGKLWISWNDSLTNLNGLDNINSNSINNLEIYENHSLSTCEVQSICEYLANPNGNIDIHDNDYGCMSQSEIEDACAVGISNTISNNDFIIYPNPAKTEISLDNNDSFTKCEIFNQYGKMVLQQTYPTNKIDISKLNQGIYFIELSSNKTKTRQKLIIN